MALFLRSKRLLITILLLAAAAAWRGWGLWSRGLLEHDEGHALLNANTWHSVMRWVLAGGLWGQDGATIAQLRDELHRQGGTLYSAGKFGYSLLLAVTALPVEVTAGMGLTLAWICGLSVCFFVGLLTWQFSKSFPAAAIAGMGCVISPLLGYLSREVSGTIWALMFGLAGANAIYAGVTSVKTRRRWLLGFSGGALLGYGFTSHYNIAPLILAVFVMAGLAGSEGSRSMRRLAGFGRALLPAAAGSLLMLAVFEVTTQVVDYRLRSAFPEYRSVFGELIHLFTGVELQTFGGKQVGDGVVGWGADAWLYYGAVLWREGALWLAMLLLAVPYYMVRQRDRSVRSGYALILLVVPLVFWVLYSHRVERVLGMSVAASWIMIGVTAGGWLKSRRLSWRKPGTVTVVVCLLVADLAFTASPWQALHSRRSPIPEVTAAALDHVLKDGGEITAGSFDVGFAPLWKWTVVEQMRESKFAGITGHVDFSRFDGATIVFVDPSTWSRPDEDFSVTKDEVLKGKLILRERSTSPDWTVESWALNQK